MLVIVAVVVAVVFLLCCDCVELQVVKEVLNISESLDNTLLDELVCVCVLFVLYFTTYMY